VTWNRLPPDDSTPARESSRRPRWIYATGDEPDYRFSLANERTFLAWIRTSLALLAAGVALDLVKLSIGAAAQRVLATLLVAQGLGCAVTAWTRWGLSERAIRRRAPLPAFGWGAGVGSILLAIVLSVVLAFL